MGANPTRKPRGQSTSAAAKKTSARKTGAAKKPSPRKAKPRAHKPGAPGAVRTAANDSRTDDPVQSLRPDGTLVRPLDVSPELLIELFRNMLRIRILDGRMLNLQRQGRIGFYGEVTGQEAAVAGSAAAIGPDDYIVPALREAGVAVCRGYPLRRLLAQLAGTSAEVSQGRQMPCHHSWKDGRFVSMSSVIGTQIPHAAGLARAAQIRGDRIAVMGYLGDGATSASDFHSGLNFAAVWKAPVVFLCQNNQWAISVPFARQTASASVAIKAGAYGMPGIRVDGNDVLAVYLETRAALERARAGEGPTLIEALTYRRKGHSSSDDPTRYRDPAEVEAWAAKDPIERLRKYLQAERILDAADEERMEEEIHHEISLAIQEAENDEPPGAASLVADVFQAPTSQQVEQRDRLLDYISREPS